MGRRGRKVQQQQQGQGQKLVDYSLHVRAEYWDRLNVLFPASRSSQSPTAGCCCSVLPMDKSSFRELYTTSYNEDSRLQLQELY